MSSNENKMAAFHGKQYGLSLPQKSASKSAPLSRPSVFGDDSDDEMSVGESLQKEAVKKKMMKQTRLEMEKALKEDSSVYEYDSVYDDIQKQRLESNKKLPEGTDRKPKYIHQLMRAVEERKKEQERREERKIQKEREAEGEKFSDKEAYVTSAYRQKLRERQEELEREKRAEEIEAALDVRKQKDLSGFYRHFLNQTVGEEPLPDRSTNKQDESKPPVENTPPRANDSEAESTEGQNSSKAEFSKSSANSSHSKRQYRQRSPSSGSEDERKKQKKREKEKRGHGERDRARSRDGEREDKHKEDRDRHQKENREKEQHQERDGDRGRDRRVRETEERYRKRNRADSKQERHGERESHKDDNDKERQKENETQVRQEDTQDERGAEAKTVRQSNKFAKRSSEQTVSSARERYLARQMARSAAKTYVEKEDE